MARFVAWVLALSAAGVASLPARGGEVKEITQYGITWAFDKPVQSGQFVTGDWWVVGPVNVVSVTPTPGPAPAEANVAIRRGVWGDTSLRNDNRMRNGAMVVLQAGGRQGYDSRSSGYDANRSVRFPHPMGPGSSLISTVSNTILPVESFAHKILWPSEKKCQCVLRAAAVLTCLAEAPPEGAFRPPYAGTDKPLYRAKDLKWDLLLNLKPPVIEDKAYWPTGAYKLKLPDDWEEVERYFQRPYLDHFNSWVVQELVPTENQPNYGREFARLVSLASLMVHLDVPKARKEKVVVGLVQRGIDLWGIAHVGGSWSADGGHHSGRKWPILFASLMLNDANLRRLPESTVFHEDVQTYYGLGWCGQTALWQMVSHHGPRQPYEEKPPEQWEQWDKTSEGYRCCCNAVAWAGTALSARLMKAIQVWGHDAFFDYCDRWMREDDPYAGKRGPHARPAGEGKTFDPFVDAMWRAYRKTAPEQEFSGKDLKWVWERGKGKWVDNPKPLPDAAAAHAAEIIEARSQATREREERERQQERKANEKYGKEADRQHEEARKSRVPEGYFVLIPAEKPAGEGGGKVTVTTKPAGAHGDAFKNWDNKGHWLEYDFEVAQDGYYQVVFKYAWGEGGGPGTRSVQIDGEYPCDAARAMAMPGTGGWSNWKFHKLRWPEFLDKPFLVRLKAGKHRMRLENVAGGGVNLDYIVIAAPFLDVTKERVERPSP